MSVVPVSVSVRLRLFTSSTFVHQAHPFPAGLSSFVCLSAPLLRGHGLLQLTVSVQYGLRLH